MLGKINISVYIFQQRTHSTDEVLPVMIILNLGGPFFSRSSSDNVNVNVKASFHSQASLPIRLKAFNLHIEQVTTKERKMQC